MPYITKQEIAPFESTKLITNKDFGNLAEISRKLKLKKDETGFSAMAMRNFLYGHTCSEKTKEVILKYFQDKLMAIKKEVDRVFR